MNLPSQILSRFFYLTPTFLFAVFLWTASIHVVADDESSSSESAKSTTLESSSQPQSVNVAQGGSDEAYVPKTETELRRSLSRIEFDVTQNEATEPAFRNKYWNNKSKGIYDCIVCGQELFSSDTKFRSGTGWPSFYAPLNDKSVGYKTDNYLFYSRTEVHCARCNAHLGHVFDDGPQPTGKRYCMNSASLKFVEKKEKKSDKTPDSGSD